MPFIEIANDYGGVTSRGFHERVTLRSHMSQGGRPQCFWTFGQNVLAKAGWKDGMWIKVEYDKGTRTVRFTGVRKRKHRVGFKLTKAGPKGMKCRHLHHTQPPYFPHMEKRVLLMGLTTAPNVVTGEIPVVDNEKGPGLFDHCDWTADKAPWHDTRTKSRITKPTLGEKGKEKE